jgi:hypothetical protein
VQIIYELKWQIQALLGYIFEGIEFEELVLYSMASNSDLFDTGMFRYREKQLDKKI